MTKLLTSLYDSGFRQSSRLRKYFQLLAIFILILAFFACNFSGGTGDPYVRSVTVEPSAVSTLSGIPIVNKQLTATVFAGNGAPQTVTWRVLEDGTGNKVTISETGILNVTADATAGTAIIRATSTFDTTKYGECLVMVGTMPSVIIVSVSPSTATTTTGTAITNQQLTATVTVVGGASQSVTWSVQPGATTGSDKVTVSTTGILNVAPDASVGFAVIRATSTYDSTKYGECIVTVGTPPAAVISVSVSPSTATTHIGTAITNQQLTATVTVVSAASQAVTWSVYDQGTTGSGKVTVSSSGMLNVAADASKGTATIRATSTFDSTKYGECTVTVKGWIVSTLAGGTYGYADGQGDAARFYYPTGVAVDSAGNIYVGDVESPTNNHRIRKITPGGNVTTLAGSGTAGSANGQGTAAQFNYPAGVAVDSAGNVYVADVENNRIRKITPGGLVSTLAGSSWGYADGQGTAAQFDSPECITVDSAGNVYVADTDNHRIRKITSTGNVTTLAGSGTAGNANGTGTSAQFNLPYGIAVDGAGNLYVADRSNHRIRKIASGGTVTTLAGSTQGYADGQGTAAQFNMPKDVAVDSSGNLYVADTDNNRIRKITPAGTVITLAGSGTAGHAEGQGTAARFNYPVGIAVDTAGNLYVGDYGNHRVRKITPEP